jgi:hypothetical protein
MPPVIDASDPTVTKLQNAARQLQARHVPQGAIIGYVKDALAPPVAKLLLPATFHATHETGGLPGFPAIDNFAPAGRAVGAPDDGQLIWPHLIPWSPRPSPEHPDGKACGGMTCYYRTASATYFLTHFSSLVPRGHYKRGDTIGHVAAVPHGWWQPHIHEGRGPRDFVPARP